MPSPSAGRPQGGDAGPTRAYPSERSFVVQLRSDADPANGEVRGRAEHVASSRAATFDSLPELARFFAEAIRAGSRALAVLGLLLAGAASAQRAPLWEAPLEERDVELVASAAAGGLVFVSGREEVGPEVFQYRGIIAALDATTGEVVWLEEGDTATGNTGGADWDSVLGPLALSNGVVVAGGGRELAGPAMEGVVRAYDQRTGTLLWSRHVGNGDYTEVAAVGGVAIAATTRSAPRAILVQAYDLVTGGLLWDETLGGDLEIPTFGGLAAAGRAVALVGSDVRPEGGAFVSVHDAASGDLLWDDLYEEEDARTYAFAAAVSGRRLFVGGVRVEPSGDSDDLLLAYDLKKGTPLWSRSESLEGHQQVLALAPNGGSIVSLVLNGFDVSVRSRRARTGDRQWTRDLGVQIGLVSRALAAKGKRVVVGTTVGVFGLDARTGRTAWDASRGGFGAAIRGKQVFVPGVGGTAAYPLR